MGSIKEINPDVWGKSRNIFDWARKHKVLIVQVIVGSIIGALAIWYFPTAIAIITQ